MLNEIPTNKNEISYFTNGLQATQTLSGEVRIERIKGMLSAKVDPVFMLGCPGLGMKFDSTTGFVTVDTRNTIEPQVISVLSKHLTENGDKIPIELVETLIHKVTSIQESEEAKLTRWQRFSRWWSSLHFWWEKPREISPDDKLVEQMQALIKKRDIPPPVRAKLGPPSPLPKPRPVGSK